MREIFVFGEAAGAMVVTLPRFDLEQFLQTLQERRITFAYLAPPIILALAKHPLVGAYDLSHLRGLHSGAAPLGVPIAQACAERLGCPVKQGYGMIEASPVTHTTPLAPKKIKLCAVGPLIPSTECIVVDILSGARLGCGEQGEIWVRGPQVMRGYLNNPEATAATVDADGWLHTGDIGAVDEDGYLVLADRLKELIKYNAFQVAPAELEALLLGHPSVADVAVVGRPDVTVGELPVAYVVARAPVSADELMAYVAERVAPHKKIRGVEFIDQIPKAPSGKLLRRILVERERARIVGG